MKLTRRDTLKLGIASTGTLFSPLVHSEAAVAASPPCNPTTDCCPPDICMVGELPNPPLGDKPSPIGMIGYFEQTLPIPQILKPQTINGLDCYEMTMKKATLELVPAKDGKPPVTAEFWTYNGSSPGPLIHRHKLAPCWVRFINQLGNDAQNEPICTSIHLHGMGSLPQYDGYAEDLIPLNHYKDYFYPNNRASILWYHDHAVHHTSRNVYMGLAGMYVVEYGLDDFCGSPTVSPLPSGEFEIPLILQDKTFTIPDPQKPTEWKIVFNDRPNRRGVYADVALVNGKPWPTLKVKRRKYFFRVLNASASRTYQLTLSNHPTTFPSPEQAITLSGEPPKMMVVGSDAGLLAHRVDLLAPKAPLRIGIAERYGIVIDFAQFRPEVDHIYLRNLPFPGNLGAALPVLMRFELEPGVVDDPSSIPDHLGVVTPKAEMIQRAKPQKRVFRFSRGRDWTINGRTWDKAQVDGQPNICDTEIWEFINTGGWTHPVHVHLVDFRVLKRNGLDPLPYETGWKDVVLLSDAERVEVVAQFAPHKGKYMIHCHNVVHEDHDMMTQFEIVGRNEQDEIIRGPLPCSDPAQPLPAPPLGSKAPPKEKPTVCATFSRPPECPPPPV